MKPMDDGARSVSLPGATVRDANYEREWQAYVQRTLRLLRELQLPEVQGGQEVPNLVESFHHKGAKASNEKQGHAPIKDDCLEYFDFKYRVKLSERDRVKLNGLDIVVLTGDNRIKLTGSIYMKGGKKVTKEFVYQDLMSFAGVSRETAINYVDQLCKFWLGVYSRMPPVALRRWLACSQEEAELTITLLGGGARSC
jgi:hypothetical protein